MQRNILILLFLTHVVLLLLASTNLSIISWMWGNRSWNWNYFQYTHANGWGYRYQSPYSLLQVLLYVAAYALGIVVFATASIRHRIYLAALAAIVCLLGAASFALEATHWLWSHNLSWIASFPAVLLVLWIAMGIQIARMETRR